MTKLTEIYKCEKCGNIIEVLHTGVGELVCCEEAMQLLEAKTADVTLEKHVPVVEKTADGVKIIVGSTLHPMEEKHYIEWIEIITENKILRQRLKPGDKPEAFFKTTDKIINVREYCNLHGLWQT